MLGADLIGFHTLDDATQFMECAKRLVGAEVTFGRCEIRHDGHLTRVGSFPIGVEADEFDRYGSSIAVKREVDELRASMHADKLILGVDRLDYTKGILQRLGAYESFLAEHPEWHGRVCFVQIQVPSRESVPEYRMLREQIDRSVGRISGRFSTAQWTPVRYLCKGFSRRDLAVFYRAADVMLVTPLRDGMNLVAQEFVATRSDEDGVLILSRFAGAAERLREAILVNPYEPSAMQQAIERALRLPARQRRSTIRIMRKRVVAENVNWWLDEFLSAAAIAPPARRLRSRAHSG
jgi:trehalose-6-phosphate synthase